MLPPSTRTLRPAMIAFVLLGIAAFAQGQNADEKPVEFVKVEAEHPATTFTVSDDGNYLFIAHEKENKVSIWDVRSGKSIRVADCPSPHHLLSRRGFVYALSRTQGKITVLSKSQNWGALRGIALQISEPYYLSAPGGNAFKGELFVTGGSYADRQVVAVHTLTSKTKLLFKPVYMAVATPDWQGEIVIIQSDLGNGRTCYFPYKTFYEEEHTYWNKPNQKAIAGAKSLMYQVRQGPYWCTSNAIVNVESGQSAGSLPGQAFIPDIDRDMAYVLQFDKDGKSIKAYLLGRSLEEVGSRPLKNLPHAFETKMGDQKTPYTFSHPVAVTHGTELYLFVHHAGSDTVSRAVTTAFPLRPGARPSRPATQEPNKPATVSVEDLDALTAIEATPMPTEAIGKTYLDAIVMMHEDGAIRSGVIVGERGYLVTTAGGLKAGDTIEVTYQIAVGDRKIGTRGKASVVAIDGDLDLALLKVETAAKLKMIHLASDDAAPKPGDRVVVLGYVEPGKPGPTDFVSETKVDSAKHEVGGQTCITTKDGANPGKVGGALLDANGQLVGLIRADSDPEKAALALPAAKVRAFLKEAAGQ